MPATMQYTGRLVITSCWCGIHMAIPEDLYDIAQRKEGKQVWCPLGHTFVYGDAENKRLRREAAQAQARLEEERRRRMAEAELRRDTELRLRAQKGATTKARKRHAAGVCPACKRTFSQLARHMESQHPDFDPAHHG
jgi:hypothetical protein